MGDRVRKILVADDGTALEVSLAADARNHVQTSHLPWHAESQHRCLSQPWKNLIPRVLPVMTRQPKSASLTPALLLIESFLTDCEQFHTGNML